MSKSASELYMGEVGARYWERNKNLSAMRCSELHALFLGEPPGKSWLELGCGRGNNLRSWDIGIDIDPRNHPHLALDVRGGLPFTAQSFEVVFCVGLLMHLPSLDWAPEDGLGDAEYVLGEMGRVAKSAVIIGEYVADREKDLLWDPESGTLGSGQSNLVWERPYHAPPGFVETRRTSLPSFGESVTFLVFTRNPRKGA